MTTTGKVLLAEFLGTFYLYFAGIPAVLCAGRVSHTRGVPGRGRTPLTLVSARDR